MLRDYQINQKNRIYNAWNDGKQFILSVLPTGAGKTVVMSSIFNDLNYPSIAIAHRQELIYQISMALARECVHHRIIAPVNIIKFICSQHVIEYQRSFFDPNANVAVAGVDTLNRRDNLDSWFQQIKLWQTDEGHHLVEGNKWHKAVQRLPHAYGIGWTATPERADRRPLRSVFQELIVGPTMRELIERGHLCDFIIYGPPNAIDISRVRKSSVTGDLNQNELRTAAHESQITGDIVGHYLKFTPGKLGVTFAVDAELAEEHSAAFNAAGVPARVVTCHTPDKQRVELVRQFRAGDLKQLVNVDIFGEGFDLPAIEVVSMARPTASYGLYVQQFGRALRTKQGKRCGIIIDHVGNVARHGGPPDTARDWTLDTPERERRASDDIPVRFCVNPECFRHFEGYSVVCPFCGHRPEPASRSKPDQVEGDLTEYGPDLIAQLRGEIKRVDGSPRLPVHAGPAAVAGAERRWQERQEAQANLRDAIAWWAGVRRDVYGDDDSVSYRRFYRTFGVDVLTAQTLGRADADKLYRKVWDDISEGK